MSKVKTIMELADKADLYQESQETELDSIIEIGKQLNLLNHKGGKMSDLDSVFELAEKAGLMSEFQEGGEEIDSVLELAGKTDLLDEIKNSDTDSLIELGKMAKLI